MRKRFPYSGQVDCPRIEEMRIIAQQMLSLFRAIAAIRQAVPVKPNTSGRAFFITNPLSASLFGGHFLEATTERPAGVRIGIYASGR